MRREVPWPLFLLWLATNTPFALAAAPQPVVADVTSAARTSEVRTDDAVWLISTRHLGCPDPATARADLQVMRYGQDRTWQASSLTRLLEGQTPARRTVLYVHGNREDDGLARQRGVVAYRALADVAGNPPPLRFVIWSWPSDQVHGVRRDVLSKAARSDVEAYYLAQFLAGLGPATDVGLWGYSFGARIITGGLHLLGGGTLVGWKLPEGPPRGEHRFRAVLMAAAVHDYWLLPGNAHGQCWSQLDQLVIQVNGCDPVLRWYPRIDRCSRPQALGRAGFSWTSQLGEDATRLRQPDVSCAIGSEHQILSYLESTAVMSAVHDCLLRTTPAD